MNRPDIRRLPKRANPKDAAKMLLEYTKENIMPRETIPLETCFGRVLAEDVYSNKDIPSYDKTFIDGYAVNPQDTAGASTTNPAGLKIVGKVFPADYPTKAQVHKGEAIYVATGAPIPKGALAVVKVEETRLKEGAIEVVREIKTGEGIIPLGDDVKKGALVLRKGQVLRPQDVGLLASVKEATVEVFKKPLVSIISGGDELIKQRLSEPKKFANNYALVVADLVSELGATPKLEGIMPDAIEKVTEKIGLALETSDLVITIGGSSVGVKDFVPDAINSLGKPGVVVHGISLRPGAISGFGIVNGKPIIILPGHIGSCIGGFYIFVAPLIAMLNGLSIEKLLPTIDAEINEEITNGPQFRFLLVSLKRSEGKFIASPVEGGSSALTTIVKSNGYTIIPPHTELKKGTKVAVTLFSRLELTQLS